LPETQGSDSLPGILAAIVETKRSQLAELAAYATDFERVAESIPSPRPFGEALTRADSVALIAECKRRSPGAGSILPDLDASDLTTGYERAGAAALSVLTDATYFGGSNDDLTAVKAATSIPVLRKDFTIDPLHVNEARAIGADAILLIVRILTAAMLEQLHREASALGMGVLVEVHDGSELERAVRLGARIIGINNRDLATFTTDLETTVRLLDDVPEDVIIVSESGIRGPDDVRHLGDVGVDAILVGEALLRAPDPEVAAEEMVGIPKRSRRRG